MDVIFGRLNNTCKNIVMSHPVSKVLNGKYVFGKDFLAFNTNYTVARGDRYAILHNTMRLVHIILIDNIVEFHIPKECNVTHLPVFKYSLLNEKNARWTINQLSVVFIAIGIMLTKEI